MRTNGSFGVPISILQFKHLRVNPLWKEPLR
jgi:hypothetical protein